MKILLLFFFLFFSIAAVGQEASPQPKERENPEEEKLLKKEAGNPTIAKVAGDTLVHSGKEIILDSLNRRQDVINLPDLKLDSTTTDQVTQQIKSIGLDSINNQKLLKENDYLQEIFNISIDSTTSKKVRQQLKTIAEDSLNNQKFIRENSYLQEALNMPADSTTTKRLKEQVKSTAIDSLNNQKFIKENQYIGDVRELEQLREIPKDSLGGYVKEEISERGEEYIRNSDEFKALTGMEEGEGLASLEEYKDQIEQTPQELQQAIAKDELKQKLASQGKQFVSEHMEQIQQVQEQMGKLKQKYNSITNSEDMSSAVKRTSLEGESIWKRLALGGNFNVGKTNPLQIDMSTVMGYRFNKLFEIGVTATYRTQFKAVKYRVQQGEEEVFGFSAYATHMVFKTFFGYIESERMKKSGSILENSYQNWHQTLLIGIGRRFPLTSWLEMQSVVVINVLHDNKDGLYSSPIMFKIGFRKAP